MKGVRCAPTMRAISIVLRAALSRYNAIFSEEIGRRPVTSLQLVVLGTLAARGSMNQVELREHTGIDRSTLSEMLRRLDKAGLIENKTASGDRRMTMAKITDNGRKQLAIGTEASSRAERRFLAPITDAKLASLRSTLDKLGID